MAPMLPVTQPREIEWRGGELRPTCRGTAPAHISRDWVAPLRPASRPTSVIAGSRPPSSRTPLNQCSRQSLASEQSPRELSWLPPLGLPLQGCCSTPSLRGRWRLGQSSRSLRDAKTFSETAASEAPSPKRSIISTGSSIGRPASQLAVKKHVRNHAVYQRWQVVSSSNRFQSEEVLERDRQRQRAAACDLRSRGGGRHNASPARSHAAALFFGSGVQEEPSHLPPGALQHVARPPSRSMDIMPNNAAGPAADIPGAGLYEEGSQSDSDEGSSATSSAAEGSESPSERSNDLSECRRSSRESEIWKPAIPRKHIPHSIGIKRKVEDLPDINTLYEPRELAQLFKCVDSFVHLVLPPGANVAHTPEMFLQSMLASLTPVVAQPTGVQLGDRRPITPSDVGGSGGYLRDKDGPLVLRPIFCRFLLGSKLCGSRDSPHRYQDCVAAFDAHASRYEAFSGMPRNLLLRVLSGIVLPPGCEASLMASAFSEKAVRQLPIQVRRFLDHHLRHALAHCEARRQALEDSIAKLPWVDTLLWLDPGLLPKVEEEELKEEEVPRSRRGERPKLENSSSMEEPKRVKLTKVEPAPTLRLPPGLWPPLPPRYVISERGLQQWNQGIRQWEDEIYQQSPLHLRALYENTAKVVMGELLSSQLLEPEVLHFTSRFQPLFTRIFEEYADEHSADFWLEDSSSSSESGTEPSTPRARKAATGANLGLKESDKIGKILKRREGPPNLMSFNAFFYFCTEFELFPKHASFDELKMIYDSSEMAQPSRDQVQHHHRRRARNSSTSQAAVALAAQLPQVDLSFMDQPMPEMNETQLKVVFFFAALEQWLESRFLRLADLVARRMPWSLEEVEDGSGADRRPDKRTRRAAIASKEQVSGEAMRKENSKERSDTKREALERRIVQLPPSMTLSASEFLEIASPPHQRSLITLEDLEACFRLLLKTDMTPEISVYQLDKVLSKAKAVYDRTSVANCFMLKPDAELTASQRATRQFLDALDRKLLERYTRGDKKLEALFDGDVTPAMLIRKGITFALSPSSIPAEKDLATSLAEIGGDPETGTLSRTIAFRALALARRYRHIQHANGLKARSALLAQQTRRSTWCPEGSRRVTQKRSKGATGAPARRVFRVSAFVECLVKLALHRLGSKGQLELQRGAPTWWKCTWLLNLLGIRFTESVKDREHYEMLKRLVQEKPTEKTTDLDFWWYHVHQTDRPRYMLPLERLARNTPDLFQPWKAEAPILVPEDRKGVCPECQEARSPSGWGTPGCLSCSEIESFCLPFDQHMFSKLVKKSLVSASSDSEDIPLNEDGSFKLPFNAEEINNLTMIT